MKDLKIIEGWDTQIVAIHEDGKACNHGRCCSWDRHDIIDFLEQIK